MVEVRFDVNLTFLRIGQMIANMVFLAHMLGCFWFYMAVIVGSAAAALERCLPTLRPSVPTPSARTQPCRHTDNADSAHKCLIGCSWRLLA